MSTTQASSQVQTVVTKLLGELEQCVDTTGKVKNDDIVGGLQNTMLDLGGRLKIDQLPASLQDLYYRSKINPRELKNYEILRRSLLHMAATCH